MSSRYWTFTPNIVDGQTARGEQVNTKYREIETALEGVALEMNKAIRLTDITAGVPAESTYQLPHPPAQRASKFLGFDAGGNLTLHNAVFQWKGPHNIGTTYNVNDVVQGPEDFNFSIYIAKQPHTAIEFDSDLLNGRWEVMIDLTQTRQSLILHTLIEGPAAVQLEAGMDLMIDVSLGAVTLILPSEPETSDQPINIMHIGGDLNSNPITIDRNGKLIMGFLENMTVDTANASFGLAYSNDVFGWRIRGV